MCLQSAIHRRGRRKPELPHWSSTGQEEIWSWICKWLIWSERFHRFTRINLTVSVFRALVRRRLVCLCLTWAMPSWEVGSWDLPMPWPTLASPCLCEYRGASIYIRAAKNIRFKTLHAHLHELIPPNVSCFKSVSSESRAFVIYEHKRPQFTRHLISAVNEYSFSLSGVWLLTHLKRDFSKIRMILNLNLSQCIALSRCFKGKLYCAVEEWVKQQRCDRQLQACEVEIYWRSGRL